MPVASLDLFRRHLLDAISAHDFATLTQLIEQSASHNPPNSEPGQWIAYARGYLACEAEQDYPAAIAQFEELRRQPDLDIELSGRTLNSLGIAYELNEQWDQALRCHQAAAAHYEQLRQTLELSRSYLNLSLVHFKATDYPAAQRSAQRSIALLQTLPADPRQQIYLGAALNQLGLALTALGVLDEAEHAIQQSLAIWQTQQDQWGEGVAYENLGDLYALAGRLPEAEASYQQAITLQRASGNLRQTAYTLHSLASVGLRSHSVDTTGPLRLLDEALTTAQQYHNHEALSQIYLRRAELWEKAGEAAAALAETQQAVAVSESLRANIMLPDDRARLSAARSEAYEQMVRRLLNYGKANASPTALADAFHYAEMGKARTLIELLGQRQPPAPAAVADGLLQRERELRRQLDQHYRNAELDAVQVAADEAELNQIREQIRLQAAEYASFQTVNPLTLAEVQRRLPPQATLLEYVILGQEIHCFVVTSNHTTAIHLPLTLDELRRAFRQIGGQYGTLHNLVRATDQRLRTPWLLTKLYQLLIAPLGEAVQHADPLLIVPHGLLHYLPFHALHTDASGGSAYLCERDGAPRQVIYAPSATVLLDYCQQKAPSSGQGCLAVGFDGGTLTQAAAEAQAIVLLAGGMALTGAEATRTALLDHATDYRYLHLSCHGWFNPTWPLLSGLALADGTLDTVDVLRQLRLNTELVCLSACETGRNQILRGDELIGLTRAFLYAGTPSLLVSQWVVDELSTRLLMERFYAELLTLNDPTRMSKQTGAAALALSRAQQFLRNLRTVDVAERLARQGMTDAQIADQLAYLRATQPDPASDCPFAHPYYWAPFFLIGDRL